VQLFHAGRERARFIKDGNEQALAPSFIHDDPYFPEKYRSMTEDEIWDIIQTFGDAAQRAREAEFDAVQVHGAHAYLFSQFLSPKK
jgi:2,4-dienoyl-CoA reductase-like NADH-dependent reductase (Old Yellow Enzyme family)